MELTLITPPTTTPVSLAEIKADRGVDDDALHPLLMSLLKDATAWVEDHTERQLVTAAYRADLDGFRSCGCRPVKPLVLPRGPIQAVTSITYLDVDQVTQTLATNKYRVGPAGVYFSDGLPSHSVREDAVKITFTSGYGTADRVPNALKLAVKRLVATWLEDRETVTVPEGIYDLCRNYRHKGVARASC